MTAILEKTATLRLAPDVNVVSRGPILMQGTRERPINVIPDVPGKPWGTFSALRPGPDATGKTSALIRHPQEFSNEANRCVFL